MITCLGFPSDFFTFAVDDIYGLLNIRLSLRQINKHTFPTTDNGLTAALKDGAECYSVTHARYSGLLVSLSIV
jgi:hypothetical protein